MAQSMAPRPVAAPGPAVSGWRRLVLCALAALAGCVSVEATLRSDGSARVVMIYRTPPDATEFLERRRFSSPNVSVDSVKIFEDQTTVVRATVADVTKLGGSPGFERIEVARERRGADEELILTLKNPKPPPEERDPRQLFAFNLTLPGPVRSANHDAAVLGSRLSWAVPREEYARQAAVTLRVRYTPPS